MQKLHTIIDFMSESGLYEQKMSGYIDKEYTIQIFEACKGSWFYILIYRHNDELIGVGTFITDGTQTVSKIKYAKNKRVVERLFNKIIKIKEEEYT